MLETRTEKIESELLADYEKQKPFFANNADALAYFVKSLELSAAQLQLGIEDAILQAEEGNLGLRGDEILSLARKVQMLKALI